MIATITERAFGLGEWAATTAPNEVLTCLGLGSCVAIVAFDPAGPVGGMAHMVLPDSTVGRVSHVAPAKFVDLGVPLLVEAMLALGAERTRMQIHLVGGASMLGNAQRPEAMNIGERNAEAARKAVAAQRLRVQSEHLGGTLGRTVRLLVATGEIQVTTAGMKQ